MQGINTPLHSLAALGQYRLQRALPQLRGDGDFRYVDEPDAQAGSQHQCEVSISDHPKMYRDADSRVQLVELPCGTGVLRILQPETSMPDQFTRMRWTTAFDQTLRRGRQHQRRSRQTTRGEG